VANIAKFHINLWAARLIIFKRILSKIRAAAYCNFEKNNSIIRQACFIIIAAGFIILNINPSRARITFSN